jgi:hypothetical protein
VPLRSKILVVSNQHPYCHIRSCFRGSTARGNISSSTGHAKPDHRREYSVHIQYIQYHKWENYCNSKRNLYRPSFRSYSLCFLRKRIRFVQKLLCCVGGIGMVCRTIRKSTTNQTNKEWVPSISDALSSSDLPYHISSWTFLTQQVLPPSRILLIFLNIIYFVMSYFIIIGTLIMTHLFKY